MIPSVPEYSSTVGIRKAHRYFGDTLLKAIEREMQTAIHVRSERRGHIHVLSADIHFHGMSLNESTDADPPQGIAAGTRRRRGP